MDTRTDPKPDANIQIMLDMYPELKPRYEYMTVSAAIRDMRRTPGDDRAVYIVDEPYNAALARMRRAMPEGYRLIQERDVSRLYRAWTFVPEAAA